MILVQLIGPPRIGGLTWAVYRMNSSGSWEKLKRISTGGEGARFILQSLLEGKRGREPFTPPIMHEINKFLSKLVDILSGRGRDLAKLAKLRTFGPERLFILDIQDDREPDAATFGEVVSEWTEVHRAGGMLAIVGSARFMEQAKVTHLDEILSCFTSIDEAISFLEQKNAENTPPPLPEV